MIIIAYEPNIVLGGYGDRVIGMIACKLICKLLNTPFKILWTKENIKTFINYNKYDYEKIHDDVRYTLNIIDHGDMFYIIKNMFMDCTTFYIPNTKIYLNQEISQYLYKNKMFQTKNYLCDIFEMYKTLYTDILVPKPNVILKTIKILSNTTLPIIGIQIRSGDVYINTHQNEPYIAIQNPEENIKNILIKIRTHIQTSLKLTDYNIFVTSDYFDIYNMTKNIFTNVLYNFDEIQHTDRPITGDFSKFYVDNYILSQHTNILYISDYSNFGRVAALSAVHENHYDLNCQKINKKDLLSKHEMLF